MEDFSFPELPLPRLPPAPSLSPDAHNITLQDQIDYYLAGDDRYLLQLIHRLNRNSTLRSFARTVLAHILHFRSQDLLAALRFSIPRYLGHQMPGRYTPAHIVPWLKYFLFLCIRNASISGSREFARGLHDISSVLVGDSPNWPLIVHFLRICFINWGLLSEFDRESVLSLYTALASHLDDLDSQDLLHESLLCPVFLASLQGHQPLEIRAAAAIASASFLVEISETGEECERFQGLMVGMIQNLVGMVQSEEPEYAHKVLAEMTQLAEASPMMFRDHTKPIGECLIMAMENLWYCDNLLEQAVTFITATTQEPAIFLGMIGDVPHFTNKILSSLLILLKMVPHENPKWHYLEGEDPEANMVSLCPVGEGCLKRMTRALGESAVMTNLPHTLLSDLVGENWEGRHAALSFIGITIAKCHEGYTKSATRLLVMRIFSLIGDPNCYVRGAAINAVKELSVYLGPQWRKPHHKLVLPALLLALNDFQNPRVQMEAVLALHFFSMKCSSQILKPYLDEIVSRLVKLLQTSQKVLKEGALEALTSVASSSQEHFQDCYKAVMPQLNVMLTLSKKEETLLGRLIECITHIGLAVGKDKFRDDIDKVVQILITYSSQSSGSNAKRIHFKKFIIEAWGRLCKCLGRDFQPYLSVAIPYLLKSVATSTSELVGKRYNAVAKEKFTACVTLCCCATELKEDLYLWINEVACTLIPLMAWRVDMETKTRDVAITAMLVLLKSFVLAKNKGYLQGYYGSPLEKLSHSILPALLEALRKEQLPNIRMRILESLTECMKISEPFLNSTFMADTTAFLTTCWLKKLEGDDEDRMDIDGGNQESFKLRGEQQEIDYDKVFECFVVLIKTYNIHLMPFSRQIFPCLRRMWDDGSARVRKIGMHMFRYLTEKCNADAFRSCDFHVLFDGCGSERLGDRQMAVCAIGVGAEFGGDWFKPHVQGAVSRLNLIIGSPDASRHIGEAVARDFAISALGKICKFHHGSLNAAQVMSTWLMYLPLKNDIDEAKAVHDQLCALVEASATSLASTDHNFPTIIQVFAEILWESNMLATEETVTRMINQLKRLRGLREDAWEGIVSSLPPHLHNKLEHELCCSSLSL